MTREEAAIAIINTCHRLQEEKLVMRTWGNVSMRLSDTEFLITPSGKSYDTLTPSEIVTVRFSDLSYDGEIKPSSEKGIHASAYILRPEVNFVIHTHQFFASAVGVPGEPVCNIPSAAYGLPGTKKLKESVYKTIKNNPGSDMFLMTKHGTLVLGDNAEDALKKAMDLEKICKDYFEKEVGAAFDFNAENTDSNQKVWLDDYAQIAYHTDISETDDTEAYKYICSKNAAADMFVKNNKNARPLGFFDANLQRLVYKLKYSKLK